MNQNEHIAILRENRFLRSREECLLFDQSLFALAEIQEQEAFELDKLPELYLIFEDECEHHEVMWGLLHFVEDFEGKVVVDTLIEMTPKMLLNASDWCETMHCRILNHEQLRAYYLAKLQQLPPMERNIINEFLQLIFKNFGNEKEETFSPVQTRVLNVLRYIERLESA
jgi:hypothetical protein